MAITVIYTSFLAFDFHIVDSNHSQISNVQVLENEPDSNLLFDSEHSSGICAHSLCQHNSYAFIDSSVIIESRLLNAETIENFYISSPIYEISFKVKRPPRV